MLPSLAMNLRLSERASVRLSATQTLSRPEYRELSPVLFREVIGADNVKGNPNLTRALIQNYDLRWEMYPGRGEILSLGVFAKRFERPIERIYQGTSGTRIITYVNAKSANNYGAEIELRKELAGLSSALKTFSIAANATVMKSTIEIDPTSGSITSASRKMVGQAPYVLNGGLTWTHPTAPASATLLFNRVGAPGSPRPASSRCRTWWNSRATCSTSRSASRSSPASPPASMPATCWMRRTRSCRAT
ncbi:MAG: TonB-dependent receptor [Gemmatimonadetes bacterium]|nr:TonB-dependent receptor [Gemmatimonadota bacterium]